MKELTQEEQALVDKYVRRVRLAQHVVLRSPPLLPEGQEATVDGVLQAMTMGELLNEPLCNTRSSE